MATSIGFATEMHVKIVNSPSYSPKCSYTEALKKHFSISRILSVGDIFAVRSSGDASLLRLHLHLLGVCNKVVEKMSLIALPLYRR